MKKPIQIPMTNEQMFDELLKSSAILNASMATLLRLHCELIAHLTNSDVEPIYENWMNFKNELIRQNLSDLHETFGQSAE
jgi:hypothetical protein